MDVREGGRGRDGNISDERDSRVGCLLLVPYGVEPTVQACALIRNQTLTSCAGGRALLAGSFPWAAASALEGLTGWKHGLQV